MSARDFSKGLEGYVEVKDRIRLFYEAHPDGRLVTDSLVMQLDPDGLVRVWGRALAYRTADDPHPAVGWSYMAVPGTTPYTKGSEAENVETSAWGRAIGALGIGIDKSIASANELRAKEVRADVEHDDDGSLIGTVEVGDKASSDFALRQTPDGAAIGFRLRGARGGILVECRGRLADQLATVSRDLVVGQRISVWGTVTERTFTPKGKGPVSYQVLTADRVRVPDVGDLPTNATPEPVAAPGGVTGLTEAESEAIWAEIDKVGV